MLTKAQGTGFRKMEKTEIASAVVGEGTITFKVVANGPDYTFFYKENDKPESEFKQLGGIQDGRILSTEIAGGFTGATIGMYATSKK